MPLTAQQIVTYACQEAKCPGFTAQAGDFLNQTLQELCQDYDIELARNVIQFYFNTGTATLQAGGTAPSTGSGPYALPSTYLRMRVQDGKDMIFYTLNGVPYPLIQVSLAEYLWMVQTPGFSSYPQNYATDTSLQTYTTPVLYVWPPSSIGQPASGTYGQVTAYFQMTMPDIATPATSSVVPWFPNQTILQRAVAGRLMGITGDERQQQYLGEDPDKSPLGWKVLLNNWLKNASAASHSANDGPWNTCYLAADLPSDAGSYTAHDVSSHAGTAHVSRWVAGGLACGGAKSPAESLRLMELPGKGTLYYAGSFIFAWNPSHSRHILRFGLAHGRSRACKAADDTARH